MADHRENQIRARAFELWQRDGSLDGRTLGHWLQAEQEVDEESAREARRDETEPVTLAGVVNPH